MPAPTSAPKALGAALALLAACGGEDGDRPGGARADGLPPTARPETVAELRAGMAAPRHPSDGGGRAWLERPAGAPAEVVAGSRERFGFGFEAGPEGIRAGGALYFQVSPFWGWSSPQTHDPRGVGYTTVETAAPGVRLRARPIGPQLLIVEVEGRALEPGEGLRIVYGAGPDGALVDRHAERGSTFWFAVDGDGDGVRELIAESPTVDVLPGPPAQLSALLPGVARPGEPARLALAVLDPLAAAWLDVRGTVRLESLPPGLELPATVELAADDRGVRAVELRAREPGTFRVRASLEVDGATLETTSNPVWVDPARPRVFWGDLHGHSERSDGTGLPEDWFRYARDVAALDVVALTDHDHWGMRFLDAHPELWEEVRGQVRAYHEPGRFVPLLGYEWTNWIHGHRHVLYFGDGDAGEVYSSIDPEYETPALLWDALRGQPALTFAHHSAGGPIATDWSFAPDPVLEPLTEVMSVHGSSEGPDSPARIRGALEGNFVRDALDRGFRLGFVGSGDGHDGHPGLAHLSPLYGARTRGPRGPRAGNGGLAAIEAEALTREALLEALRARRTWATSGPRILLEVELAGHRAGSAVPAAELAGEALLRVRVSGTAGLAAVDLIRSGALVERTVCDGRLDLLQVMKLADLRPEEYVYVRVEQADGGLAWSSPLFVE